MAMQCPRCGATVMQNDLLCVDCMYTLDAIEEAEREAHAAVSAALANPDGQSAARVQARLVAKEFGLDGDTTSQINERLDNGRNQNQ